MVDETLKVRYRRTRSRVRSGASDRKRELGIGGILMIAAVSLAFGHLLLKTYMPNVAVGGIGFVVLAVLLYYVLVQRNYAYGFVMVIYICDHFSYADNQGGTWNLLAFGILLIYFAVSRRRERFEEADYTMGALLLVLVLSNVVGWALKNPMPIIPLLLGAASFLSFPLMFHLVSNLRVSARRVRQLLIIAGVMLAYEFLVGINQRYAFVNWSTPLLGAYAGATGAITYGSTHAHSTFRNSELYGEYCVLMLTLLIPFLYSSLTQKVLRLRVSILAGMILLSFAGITLTTARSTAILAVLAMVTYAIVFAFHPTRAVDAVRRQAVLYAVIGVFILGVGSYVGLGSIATKFTHLEGQRWTMGRILSGKDINRFGLVQMAIARIESESWIIGNGFGIPRSNYWAWFGQDPGKPGIGKHLAGFHNLYVSLPMVYGWFGSVAFLLMILVTEARLLRVALRYRRRRSYLVVLATAMSMFWVVFLADQYKISILRQPTYHMLFWIWLGWSNAIVKTMKVELRRPLRRASPLANLEDQVRAS